MIDREYVELFIKLRAEGCTYDEIVERTGISKPTLIRWGKVYKECRDQVNGESSRSNCGGK